MRRSTTELTVQPDYFIIRTLALQTSTRYYSSVMDYGSDEENSGSGIKNAVIELIQFGAIVLAVLIIIRFFVAETHRVSGSSMVPNFYDGDVIITNLLAKRFGSLQRGEVVILVDPNDSSKAFIKRIVGFGGERIKLQDGKVYINDKILNEPYLPQGVQTHGEAFLGDNQEFTIPDGDLFVL